MKRFFTIVLALTLVVVLSVTAFARWSTIKTTALTLTKGRATASMTALRSDLSIEIEIYEDDILIAYDSIYSPDSVSTSLSVPFTYRSGRDYEAIAYFDADGESHTMVKYG